MNKKHCDFALTILKRCISLFAHHEDQHIIRSHFAKMDLVNIKQNPHIPSQSIEIIIKGITLFESLARLPNVEFYYEEGGVFTKLSSSIDLILHTFLSESGYFNGAEIYVTKDLSNYLSQLMPTALINRKILNTKLAQIFNQFSDYELQKEQVLVLPQKTSQEWMEEINHWYAMMGNTKKISASKLTALVAFLPKTREELEQEEIECSA